MEIPIKKSDEIQGETLLLIHVIQFTWWQVRSARSGGFIFKIKLIST